MDEKFMETAAAIEQLHRDAALANARAPRIETHPEFDGLHCVEEDCDMEIPAARLAMGKVRCVACQTRKEKRRG